jgi:hypothetical protein
MIEIEDSTFFNADPNISAFNPCTLELNPISPQCSQLNPDLLITSNTLSSIMDHPFTHHRPQTPLKVLRYPEYLKIFLKTLLHCIPLNKLPPLLPNLEMSQ